VKKCFYELAGYLIARYFFTTTEDSQAAKYWINIIVIITVDVDGIVSAMRKRAVLNQGPLPYFIFRPLVAPKHSFEINSIAIVHILVGPGTRTYLFVRRKVQHSGLRADYKKPNLRAYF
jgi:hypothetical protein